MENLILIQNKKEEKRRHVLVIAAENTKTNKLNYIKTLNMIKCVNKNIF